MKFFFFLLTIIGIKAHAQYDSIYVHLYTDSLKRGTFNYINIDGLRKGMYEPLDSTVIDFDCSYGEFTGNNLWIPETYHQEKVRVRATVRHQPDIYKEFFLYIKKEDDPQLKTEKEILEEIKLKSKKKKA